MNKVIKANLLWFITFSTGLFLSRFYYENNIIFLLGIYIVSLGSIFAGRIASK